MQTDGRPRAPHNPERHSRYRKDILGLIDASYSPISAQDIHLALRQGGAKTGLSTVYRELHALVQEHEIHELRVSEGALYRLNDGGPQSYLICDRCGRVELAPDGLISLLTGDGGNGFLDVNGALSVHGCCNACTAAGAWRRFSPQDRAGSTP